MRTDAIEREALKLLNEVDDEPAIAGTPALNFRVSDSGVFYIKDTGDSARLSARVDVVAETRDANGENWGRLLEWVDAEGRKHQWAMPLDALASDSGAVRARLLNGGLPFITTNARHRERFAEYLQTAPVERRVRCVSRTGWYEGTYVLPDEVLALDGAEETLYQPSADPSHYWRTKGTCRAWREQVGQLCSGNSRLIMAVSCGFAGPLLSLLGTESGGIHFNGGTSTGKTTALVVGGAVCGGGGPLGFVQTWRTTTNGLEAIAEAHNDGTLFIDEISQIDPAVAGETAYLLGNGQGKARMTRGISARKRLRWSLLFVSAGEMTLGEHAESAGRRTKGGVEVRMLNIDADAGEGLGMFENLHDAESADAFARLLKERALSLYGSPLRTFLQELIRTRQETVAFLRSRRDEFTNRCVPRRGAGELKRAAERFALIGAAGELATRWGLTGWREAEAMEVAERCFGDWLKARGTTGASDLERAISQVRGFLEANGAARFQALGSNQPAAERIPNRAGFTRESRGQETEYLILREVFKKEICRGHNASSVLKELDRRGFLVRDEPNMTIKPLLPELGRTRVYCIRAAIMDDSRC